MEHAPTTICTLDYLDISSIRNSWEGYAFVARMINDRKIAFAHIPDRPRVRIRIVDFGAMVASKVVEEFAARHQMRPAGPEWLSIVNASCDVRGRPLIALASPDGLNGGATVYSRRTERGVDLSVAWGQHAWSAECLFLLIAPI